MAPSGTAASVAISLHPLVIMNISEHWTRVRAQQGKAQQVIGALIGKSRGRNLEIMNSFELVFTVIENDIVIDNAYLAEKDGQFKQVFEGMDILGWYTTGGEPTFQDIHVQKQLDSIYTNPILLKLNTQVKQHSDLPVFIYESVIDIDSAAETRIHFIKLDYVLATEDAERIGVDHIAKTSTLSQSASESSSVASDHLNAQNNAVRMLHSRIKIILEYLKCVDNGSLPKRHDILREVHSLCQRLPVGKNKEFSQEFTNLSNDVHLMAYLATITKSCNTVNQFVTKFNALYEKQAMGRRVRGLFF